MARVYTTYNLSDVLIDPNLNYIIWLASWYPSNTVPFNGDFIQRHAYALALFHPLILIHTIHDPQSSHAEYYVVSEQNGLIEIVIYFRDSGITNSLMDKLRYNLKYYSVTKKFIRFLFTRISLPRFIHVHVPMKKGRIALWIRRKWKIPYIVSEQSGAYLPIAPDTFNSRNFYYRYQVSRIFNGAIAVTNVSEEVGKLLRNTFRIKNLSVIWNTVDQNLFFYRPKVNDPFRFIHVSTMKYQKNIEGLLQTFLQLSVIRNDFELCLVGAVSVHTAELIRFASEKYKIVVAGEVGYEEVAKYMKESDCFVLFSRYENFPCVIVEALCCGLPVITTGVGGAGEAINESNGVVVSSENQEALLHSLVTMMDQYHQYNREEISSKAIALYGYKPIGRAFYDLYLKFNLLMDSPSP
jgi:glycosyltransferase involved in cell wall biosynthesis